MIYNKKNNKLMESSALKEVIVEINNVRHSIKIDGGIFGWYILYK
jgi:hypothetical protein